MKASGHRLGLSDDLGHFGRVEQIHHGRVAVGDRAALHHQLEDVRLDEGLVRLGVPSRSLHLLKVVFQRVFKLDGLHGCGSEVRDVSAWTSSLSRRTTVRSEAARHNRGHGLSPRVAVGREPRELHHVGFDELDVLAY